MSSEEALLLAPPVEFKRMLSWQLSTPSTVPVRSKSRKKRRPRTTGSPPLSSESDQEDEYAYMVVVINSDGEEEVYYSAPESPDVSDDRDVSSETSPTETMPTDRGRKKSKSKKQKKKIRYMTRKATADFLGPLCDLVCEGGEGVSVEGVDVTSHAQVPRLVELCLRRMRKDDTETHEQLPYLLRVLVQSDRSQHSLVSTLLRWMEKQLATPFQIAQVLYVPEYNREPEEHRCLPTILAGTYESMTTAQPESHCGLHVPVFEYTNVDRDFYSLFFWLRKPVTGPLLHFVNFLFPLFGREGQSSKVTEGHSHEPLTPAQLATIHYINNFIQSRYKDLSEAMSGMLLLWPGYVYWARGQVKQAVAAFQYAISQFKCPKDTITQGNHRAAMLNEIGRMLSQFSERELACRFFREAGGMAAPCLQSQRSGAWFPADRALIQPCTMALCAAVYDCGLLTPPVARDAVRMWKQVIQALGSVPYWPLFLSAVESKLLVHSGVVTGLDPNDPTAGDSVSSSPELLNKRYLEECRELLQSLVSRQPFLHYHLSMVHALLGYGESAKATWTRFMEVFIHIGWPNWLNIEPPSKFHMFNTLTPAQWYPWKPLVDLLTSSSLKQAPMLEVRWRTRLLHPRYPYYFSNETVSALADHCSQSIGIRLTGDGYITADCHMDAPPMRVVLLDPYTGELCFPREASKNHYYQQPMDYEMDLPIMYLRQRDHFSLPWPVRVLDCDHCTVELTMVSTKDSFSKDSSKFANHSAWLAYYGTDGSLQRVDLRKLIRRKLKEELVQYIRDSEDEDSQRKHALLNKLVESGRCYGRTELKWNKLPPRFIPWTPQDTKKTFKVLNFSYNSFSLSLVSMVTFGDATLMLGFCLCPDYTQREKSCNVLVFVNCSSAVSFGNVSIHCVDDPQHCYYQMVSPTTQLCTSHFKNVRYATAVRVFAPGSSVFQQTYCVFDTNGDSVAECLLTPHLKKRTITMSNMLPYFYPYCSLGSRLFGWRTEQRSAIYSCDLRFQHVQTFPLTPTTTTVSSLTPVPGLLVAHTNNGVLLLDPFTMAPLVIEGLASSKDGVKESDYQFEVLDCLFSVLNVWDEKRSKTISGLAKKKSAGDETPMRDQSDNLPQEAASGNDTSQSRPDVYKGPIRKWREVVEENDEDTTTAESDSSKSVSDFGTCQVALAVNNRVVVLDVQSGSVKCILDVTLPGKPTELHQMGAAGYVVSVTNFVDHFREEVYWITLSGHLRGVLPCLGVGPRSFLSVTLPSRDGVNYGDVGSVQEHGLYLYLNDGQGAIACLRLSD